MPFHWIESMLALAFAAVWAFIGVTLLGDRLHEVRKRRVVGHGPHFRHGKRRKERSHTAGAVG